MVTLRRTCRCRLSTRARIVPRASLEQNPSARLARLWAASNRTSGPRPAPPTEMRLSPKRIPEPPSAAYLFPLARARASDTTKFLEAQHFGGSTAPRKTSAHTPFASCLPPCDGLTLLPSARLHCHTPTHTALHQVFRADVICSRRSCSWRLNRLDRLDCGVSTSNSLGLTDDVNQQFRRAVGFLARSNSRVGGFL